LAALDVIVVASMPAPMRSIVLSGFAVM